MAEVAAVLDERARRLLLGAAARRLGRGGIKLVAAASGVSVDTVGKGAAELEMGIVADGRVRAMGAGRRPVEHSDPGLWPALDALVDPESRGDPMSALRWTTKSTVKLADELTASGHRVAPGTVARLLKDHDYSLQGNAKTLEGTQHPDRDAQFRYLNDQVSAFLAEGSPVISVDTKKKENVGTYKNGGREYQHRGEPVKVNTYDFIGEAGKAVPYGVYDVAANTGWVNVGTDADTGMFAVESIRRWWNRIGAPAYPGATRLLITADGGGSNGSRLRLWKTQLAEFATETGLAITVAHLPPGTSKWNRIEHRLFSAITMNWRGRPLETHEVVVETIAATTTTTGLTVAATLDTNTYPRGIKITDREMKAFETRYLHRHDFHGNWNYTIKPEPVSETTHPGEPT
ncbi:MAG: ISAzo13 family transposase [Pseudonocardiales bacterium]|nr:MAG: ISAzo13 family transposase [Pseudonocardiales bacterium]